MEIEGSFETVRVHVLSKWLAKLSETGGPRGSVPAITAEFEHWLSFLPSAVNDAAAAREMHKLVAFHARQFGLEGRPAAALLDEILALEDALAPHARLLPAETCECIRDVMRIAVEAHALGANERVVARHIRELRNGSPVLNLDSNTVVAFLLGPMVAEIIDSIVGRLIRACAMSGARVAVLDVQGATEPVDDRFLRTIRDVLDSAAGRELRLMVTGLADPDGFRRALERMGAPVAALGSFGDVRDYLANRK